QPVAKHLVRRGALSDVLMAAAFGDVDLVNRTLDAAPGAIRMRVTPDWFRMRDPRAGGTIYFWTLGAAKGAHAIAREFGHEDALSALMARTQPSLKLAVACEFEDAALARELRAQGVTIDPIDHVRLVSAARANRTAAARMLLEAGCSAAASDEGSTAMHWAAYEGNVDLVEALLDYGAPRNVRDARFQGTPFDWAEHGSRDNR